MAKIKVTSSSGNVFDDLGLADASELNVKAELALKVGAVIRKRAISQTLAAQLTGISQPDISRLLRGHIKEFSSDRLIQALRNLEAEVEIVVEMNGEPIGNTIHLEPMPMPA